MRITLQLPDDLARHPNAGRETLEAVAIEGYRTGGLSHDQAAQLLGLSRFEFDGFLKERGIYNRAYGLEDLEEDRETMRQLRAGGLLARTAAPAAVAAWLTDLPGWLHVAKTASHD